MDEDLLKKTMTVTKKCHWYFIFAAGSRLQLAKGPSLWLCRQNLGRPMAQRSFAGMVVLKCDWYMPVLLVVSWQAGGRWQSNPQTPSQSELIRRCMYTVPATSCCRSWQWGTCPGKLAFHISNGFCRGLDRQFFQIFLFNPFFLRLQCCNDMAMMMF